MHGSALHLNTNCMLLVCYGSNISLLMSGSSRVQPQEASISCWPGILSTLQLRRYAEQLYLLLLFVYLQPLCCLTLLMLLRFLAFVGASPIGWMIC